MIAAAGPLVGLLLLLVNAGISPAEALRAVPGHSRRLHQAAVAPAPVGQVCSNGLVCPVNQRCDTTLLGGNDGTQKVIQCLCVTGYNGPECPAPFTVPPTPTIAPATPSPPASTGAPITPSPTAAAPVQVGQVCSNGLVCPVNQRCDTTLLGGNDGTQKVIQCLCVTGYNGPECPAPFTVPPTPTVASITPSPPKGSPSSAAAAAANPASPGSSTPVSQGGSSGIGVGGIVGIVVGSVVAVALLAAGVLYAVRRRKREQKAVEFQEFHRAHHSMERDHGATPADPAA